MKKENKGYNVVIAKTNELIASIEIGNEEVIIKDGYNVIPYYKEESEEEEKE